MGGLWFGYVNKDNTYSQVKSDEKKMKLVTIAHISANDAPGGVQNSRRRKSSYEKVTSGIFGLCWEVTKGMKGSG